MYDANHSIQIVKQKAKSIEPSTKQLKYRNDLYRFCLQKGLVRKDFPLGRTKQDIKANIYAFNTILRKNGLADEFFAKTEEQPQNEDRSVCCGAIIPEGQMVCPNCLVAVKEG